MSRLFTKPRTATQAALFNGRRPTSLALTTSKSQKYAENLIFAFTGGYKEVISQKSITLSVDGGYPHIDRGETWYSSGSSSAQIRKIEFPTPNKDMRELTVIARVLCLDNIVPSQGILGNWPGPQPSVLLIRKNGTLFQAYARDDSSNQIGAASYTYDGLHEMDVVVRIEDLGTTSTIKIQVDGNNGSTATNTFGTVNFSKAADPLSFGRGPSSSQIVFNGRLVYILFFDKHIKDTDLFEIRKNPYSYFIDTRSTFFRYLAFPPVPELDIGDTAHLHLADGISLAQTHALFTEDSVHLHTSDQVDLTVPVPPTPPTERRLLHRYRGPVGALMRGR